MWQGCSAAPPVPPQRVLKARPPRCVHPPLQPPFFPQQPPGHTCGPALRLPHVKEVIPSEGPQAALRPLSVARPANQQGPRLIVPGFFGDFLERSSLRLDERRASFAKPHVVDPCFKFRHGLRRTGFASTQVSPPRRDRLTISRWWAASSGL